MSADRDFAVEEFGIGTADPAKPAWVSVESTSAALARVTAERDDLADQLATSRSWAKHLQHNIDAIVTELEQLRREAHDRT